MQADELKVQAGAVAAGHGRRRRSSLKTMPLSRSLTISSELVPFQEIDVYAKESGYVKHFCRLRNARQGRT